MESSLESKGYGYVQYKNEEDANKAMQRIHGIKLYGMGVHAVPYVSKQEREMSVDKNKFTIVFVKNMSPSTDEVGLRSIFGEFGEITSVAVMRDGEGKSKCFGFVNFERAEDAVRSVEAVNGREFDGKEWYVEAKNNVYIKNIDDGVRSEKLKELLNIDDGVRSEKLKELLNIDDGVRSEKLKELFWLQEQ